MTASNAPDTDALPLDPELARWLERSEALAFARECYAAAAELPGNPAGVAMIPIGDGFAAALTVFDHGFFNRLVGVGFERPVSEDDIEAASQFFIGLGLQQSLVHLAPPLITPEVAGWLEARGYHAGRYWVKLWRDLDLSDLAAPSTTIRIERIDQARAGDFAAIVRQAFELPVEAEPVASAPVGRPGWTHYLGYLDEEPVAAAAMFVTEGVAWLGFGATLESARGRGAQSAMFATRLADAHDLGCRWAITETGEETEDDPVNHSLRNMRRAGFRLAYARQNWVRIPAKPD